MCIFLVLGAIGLLSLVQPNVSEDIHCTAQGCAAVNRPVKKLHSLIEIIVSLVDQGYLLALLLYVLAKVKSNMQNRNQDHLKKTARRLVICAAICYASDALALATQLVLVNHKTYAEYAPEWISSITWSTTILVNIIVLVCSSPNSISVLIPCYTKSNLYAAQPLS